MLYPTQWQMQTRIAFHHDRSVLNFQTGEDELPCARILNFVKNSKFTFEKLWGLHSSTYPICICSATVSMYNIFL